MAHQYYAWYLSSQGRLDDSLAEHLAALRPDPASQITNQGICALYTTMREYDKSIEQCFKVLQMFPDTAMTHGTLSQDYELKKMYDNAVQEYQQSLTLEGNQKWAAAIGKTYGTQGWEGILLKDAEHYQQRGDYDPVAVAASYAELGEKDAAFLWLEKAYDEHLIPIFIKTQPEFDNLRSDPRYFAILRRMGLPQ